MPAEVTKDIFKYATAQVANKGILDRIGHSARFHSLRSAVNSRGSLGSKLLSVLGAAGRASFNLIPIPIIGSLLASAETAIEGKLRSLHHDRRAGQATTDAEKIKFKIKELGGFVADFDRYRWKVSQSVEEMSTKGNQYNEQLAAATGAGKVCDANLELALAIAQAERRIKIFREKAVELLALATTLNQWLDASSVTVTNYKTQVQDRFKAERQTEERHLTSASMSQAQKDAAAEELRALHASCGDFCVYKGAAINTNWDTFRSWAAAAVRELNAPFSPEIFLGASHASFEHGSQLQNYDSSRSMNAASNS